MLQRFGTVEKASIDEAYIEITKEVADEMAKMDKCITNAEYEDRDMLQQEWMLKYAPSATVSMSTLLNMHTYMHT